MKIVVLGSGNVATHLTVALKNAGHDILQVYSRNIQHAEVLGKMVDAQTTNSLNDIFPESDFYICMLKDDCLSEILKQVPATKGIWLHTSGLVGLDIFPSYISKYGVLYPLQTFSKMREIDFNEVPLFIEASDEYTLNSIENLAESISNNVNYLESEKSKTLHLAAVFANNFTNYLYDISYQILKKEEIPFEVLLPLINETVAKIVTINPKDAQTGPAKRCDTETMKKHLELLKDSNQIEIYKLLSKGIQERQKE